MTVILDGKKLSDKILNDLKTLVSKLDKKPKLAVVLVGNNPASQIYVRNKERTANLIGFESIVLRLSENTSEENIIEQICLLNEDETINAILVQLPLPENINKKRIIEAIEPVKDVDGFSIYNFGSLALGYEPYSVACTPKGIIKLLDEYNIPIEGAKVTVIGRSNIVGKPLSILLQKRNATVFMANSYTKNLKELCLASDIIVSAVGKPNFITEDYIRNGAVVIDVGINRIDSGLTGDVDFEKVKEKASFITPVPGGVGPMTIAMLMQNTYELCMLQKKLIM